VAEKKKKQPYVLYEKAHGAVLIGEVDLARIPSRQTWPCGDLEVDQVTSLSLPDLPFGPQTINKTGGLLNQFPDPLKIILLL
jgi:hypothetical protein